MKKTYQIKKTINTPVPGSNWDTGEWAKANILEINEVREESSSHHPQTELKLLYTEQSLFGLFRVQDQYVRAIRSGFQESVCRDSCVEFFFKPKTDGGYFNCEFNCSGAMLCFYIKDNTRISDEDREKLPHKFNEFRSYAPLSDADLKHVKIFHSLAKKVEPEITEPIEWFLGFELPLTMLEKYTGTLGDLSGQTWEGNCYKCADETSHPHWLSWNPIKEKNFHAPECFGELIFDT